jgi:hypothetical protein
VGAPGPLPGSPCYYVSLLPASVAMLAQLFFILTAALVAACDSGPLAPAASRPETFDWAGQQISLAPPPAGWRREGQSSGGIRGARFVKERSVGEAIGVGDYYLLANRLRRARLQEIFMPVK